MQWNGRSCDVACLEVAVPVDPGAEGGTLPDTGSIRAFSQPAQPPPLLPPRHRARAWLPEWLQELPAHEGKEKLSRLREQLPDMQQQPLQLQAVGRPSWSREDYQLPQQP